MKSLRLPALVAVVMAGASYAHVFRVRGWPMLYGGGGLVMVGCSALIVLLSWDR